MYFNKESPNQQILYLLSTSKTNYYVHSSLPLICLLIYIDPVHILPPFCFMIHLNVILIPTPWSSAWLLLFRLFNRNCVHISHFYSQCYKHNPSDFPQSHHYNNTWCTVHITRLVILQFYPTYSHCSS